MSQSKRDWIDCLIDSRERLECEVLSLTARVAELEAEVERYKGIGEGNGLRVRDLEVRISELEPLAELGRLVEQMPQMARLTRAIDQGGHAVYFAGVPGDGIGTLHLYDNPTAALRALVLEAQR